MTVVVDRDYIRDTLTQLVQINSVNPTLDPSSSGEAQAAGFVGDCLRSLGLSVETIEPSPRRTSVVGTLRGSGGGRSLMLNAHIDTVGVEGMADPFGALIHGGKLYGRGAYDMKGAMVACLAAVKLLRERDVTLRGDVIVAGVADEEYSSLGTTAVIESVQVDAAIVTEPTHLVICLAHKGYVWLTVRTRGRAAHGSRFEEGIDANMRMGRVLVELEGLERSLRTGEAHALVGPPSLHAALLRGGAGISTYAPSCELQIERRTIPGETVELVESQVQEVLDRLVTSDESFEASLDTFFAREPFEVDADAAIVRAVEGAGQRVLGRDMKKMGDTPWMDSALLAAAGIETVVIGPSGAGAHAVEEWVDLDSVADLAAVLAEAAFDYCGGV